MRQKWMSGIPTFVLSVAAVAEKLGVGRSAVFQVRRAKKKWISQLRHPLLITGTVPVIGSVGSKMMISALGARLGLIWGYAWL